MRTWTLTLRWCHCTITDITPFLHHCFLLVPVAHSEGLQSAEQFSSVPQHWADGGEVHRGGQDQGGQHPWARPSHWVLQTGPVQHCCRRRNAAGCGVQCARDGGAHQGQWLLRPEEQSGRRGILLLLQIHTPTSIVTCIRSYFGLL